MPDENTPDTGEQPNAEELPSLEYILDNWISTSKASKIMGTTTSAVTYLCRRGRIKSKRIADKWYVDPEEAQNYERSRSGPPRIDKK